MSFLREVPSSPFDVFALPTWIWIRRVAVLALQALIALLAIVSSRLNLPLAAVTRRTCCIVGRHSLGVIMAANSHLCLSSRAGAAGLRGFRSDFWRLVRLNLRNSEVQYRKGDQVGNGRILKQIDVPVRDRQDITD